MNKEILDECNIDFENGIIYCANKEKLYRKYLKTFVENSYCDMAIEAFNSNEIDKGLYQLQVLREYASIIGYKDFADALHSIIRQGACDIKSTIERVIYLKGKQAEISPKLIQAIG